MKTAIKELKKLWKPIAVLVALQLIAFAFLGRLNLPAIIGTVLGTALAVGEFVMIGTSIDTVLKKDSFRAFRGMAGDYFFRLALLAVAIFVALQVPAIDPLGFILPLFYLRLAIYYNAIKRKGESD